MASKQGCNLYLVCPKINKNQKTITSPLFTLKVIDKKSIDNEKLYKIMSYMTYEQPKQHTFLLDVEFMYQTE